MYFISPFKGLRPTKENASSVAVRSSDHLRESMKTNHAKKHTDTKTITNIILKSDMNNYTRKKCLNPMQITAERQQVHIKPMQTLKTREKWHLQPMLITVTL